MIFYFTGQPGSGKTTLSHELIAYLSSDMTSVPMIIHIDGDDIREIFQNKDYSTEGRKVNIRRAHDIAQFLEAKGFNVIISLVSPYKELRDELKSNCDVVEIYVHTTDIRGREKFHTDEYIPPIESFIDLDTTGKTVKESFEFLLKMI